MEKWRGKIAVVTGGSSGIGAAISKMLLYNGLKVVVLDINEAKGYHFFKCDVSDLNSIKKAFEWIEEQFKFVHVLVNCAGITKFNSILSESEEVSEYVDNAIGINYTGTVHMARTAYQLMKKSEDYGMIINICSIAGHGIQFPNRISIYPSTKYAVRAFSETLRQELIVMGDEKVKVTNLSPGATFTSIVNVGNNKITLQDLRSRGVKILDPNEIANGVKFVLSTPHDVNITEITIRPVGDKN